ncbi:hypothetical protein BD309DRAFT_757048 [Dichomitus squalens]|nr:hypothetical protein BD309DRAFT_757048 [Dichomitus squalens]
MFGRPARVHFYIFFAQQRNGALYIPMTVIVSTLTLVRLSGNYETVLLETTLQILCGSSRRIPILVTYRLSTATEVLGWAPGHVRDGTMRMCRIYFHHTDRSPFLLTRIARWHPTVTSLTNCDVRYVMASVKPVFFDILQCLIVVRVAAFRHLDSARSHVVASGVEKGLFLPNDAVTSRIPTFVTSSSAADTHGKCPSESDCLGVPEVHTLDVIPRNSSSCAETT